MAASPVLYLSAQVTKRWSALRPAGVPCKSSSHNTYFPELRPREDCRNGPGSVSRKALDLFAVLLANTIK